MFTTLALTVFIVAGICGLTALSIRDQRAALAARARLLDEVVPLFANARIELARDGFPCLTGATAGAVPVKIALVNDTLVTRRLPQLWLTVTIGVPEAVHLSIGALARVTGNEFYSCIHDLPERLEGPEGFDPALLLRGGHDTLPSTIRRAAPVLDAIFEDPLVKEAVVTPRGARIIRQAAQGDRGAHIAFRQIRYPIERIDPELVKHSLADAEALVAAVHPVPVALKLSA